MPSDAFMEVSTADIVGESGDKEYGKETPYGMFEISSISFSHSEKSDDATPKPAPGGVNPPVPATVKPQKKTNLGEIQIEKAIDRSSPWLFRHAVDKKLMMDWAIVYLREAGDLSKSPWLRLEFRKVRVTKFDWGIDPDATGEEALKAEKITFSFQTMLIVYSPQDPTGAHGPSEPALTANYNFDNDTQDVEPIS